jgi:hypothetical protein
MNRHSQFLTECLSFWKRAIEQSSGSTHASSLTWNNTGEIKRNLSFFIAPNRNHGHYPIGGGFDFNAINDSVENGLLEFQVSEKMVDIAKPQSLSLEIFRDHPIESFLLLELSEIPPSTIDDHRTEFKEELLETTPGHYRPRELWDRGYLSYDEDGREVPLPPTCRIVTRWLQGKILIVAKGSTWNGDPATYDGRHNRMSATEIRAVIQRALDR